MRLQVQSSVTGVAGPSHVSGDAWVEGDPISGGPCWQHCILFEKTIDNIVALFAVLWYRV